MKSVLSSLNSELNVADLLSQPVDEALEVEVAFSEDDLAVLESRLGVERIAFPTGSVQIKRWRGRGLSIRGTIQADITQTCIILLDPLTQTIAAEIDVMMFPQADPLDMDSDIDPLPEQRLAIGEILAEHLALAVDPYPRKADAVFDQPVDDVPTTSPFEALRDLQTTGKN